MYLIAAAAVQLRAAAGRPEDLQHGRYRLGRHLAGVQDALPRKIVQQHAAKQYQRHTEADALQQHQLDADGAAGRGNGQQHPPADQPVESLDGVGGERGIAAQQRAVQIGHIQGAAAAFDGAENELKIGHAVVMEAAVGDHGAQLLRIHPAYCGNLLLLQAQGCGINIPVQQPNIGKGIAPAHTAAVNQFPRQGADAQLFKQLPPGSALAFLAGHGAAAVGCPYARHQAQMWGALLDQDAPLGVNDPDMLHQVILPALQRLPTGNGAAGAAPVFMHGGTDGPFSHGNSRRISRLPRSVQALYPGTAA